MLFLLSSVLLSFEQKVGNVIILTKTQSQKEIKKELDILIKEQEILKKKLIKMKRRKLWVYWI